MASIRREVQVNASAEKIWEAVRGVGAVHERLAPGFVSLSQDDPTIQFYLNRADPHAHQTRVGLIVDARHAVHSRHAAADGWDIHHEGPHALGWCRHGDAVFDEHLSPVYTLGQWLSRSDLAC